MVRSSNFARCSRDGDCAQQFALTLGGSYKASQPEFAIGTTSSHVVCFSCPGHNEFATSRGHIETILSAYLSAKCESPQNSKSQDFHKNSNNFHCFVSAG